MGALPKPYRNPVFLLVLLVSLSCYVPLSLSDSVHESSIVVGEVDKLGVSPSLQVVNSPGTKPGTSVLCQRIGIKGLPRLRFRNLNKFSHSLKLTLSYSVPGLRGPNVEVCFHRNASVGIGMCPYGMWEKVDNGLWMRAMSPFDHKFLDIRMSGPSPENFELSLKEEFYLFRVVFLVFGVVLLSAAPTLSQSLVFYYSSAMVVGVILVVLVILFQGMKLLPTGRKSSLAIFIYSSLVGLGTFLLQYLPGLLHSLLVETGISEDLYYPLASVLLAFVVLAGAWMGFWVIRKLVLTEDGSIDISTSLFVAWSIRILAGVLILQSTLDPLLAIEALTSAIILSPMIRRICKVKFWRRLYRKFLKFIKNARSESYLPDLSPFGNSFEKDLLKTPEELKSLHLRRRQPTLASCNSPIPGYSKTPPRQFSGSDVYLSSFHITPERPKLTKDQLRESTKTSTEKALQELYSSSGFSKWVAANADRITVTPPPTKSSGQKRRSWLLWFKDS